MASTINSDNGVVSGSSGVKTTADTSGVLALQSNGSTGLTLDTSLNVGIGVTPSAWAAGSNAVQNTAGSVWRYGTDYIYLGQNYYFNGTNRIYSTTAAATEYRQGLGSHIFYTAPSGTAGNTISFTDRLTITSTGAVIDGLISASTTGKVGTTLGVGGATPSASGSGITFPATQDPSSNANTLDDYEEGTFTPTLTGATTAPSSVSYAEQTGRYTKIGRLVTVTLFLQINNRSGGTGTARVDGLPFTSANTGAAFLGSIYLGLVNWGASRTAIYAQVGQNSTYINIGSLGTNLDPSGIAITEFNSTDDYIGINISYTV